MGGYNTCMPPGTNTFAGTAGGASSTAGSIPACAPVRRNSTLPVGHEARRPVRGNDGMRTLTEGGLRA